MQKSAKSMLPEITVFRSLIKRLYYGFVKNHLIIPNPESKMMRRIKLGFTVPIFKKPPITFTNPPRTQFLHSNNYHQ